MRSIHVLGVTAVALSLGMAGALAGPASNLQAGNNLTMQRLLPAQASSSASGLSQLTNSNGSTHLQGSLARAAARSDRTLTARIGDFHAVARAARFIPNHGTARPSQAVLDALQQPAPAGLSGLDAAAPKQATSPTVQRLASATANARPNQTVHVLSSLVSR
jgi:hypothetical protein